MITFKKRERTEGLRIVLRQINGQTVEELERQARRGGKLNLGYHYVLYKNGEIHKGIGQDHYADYELQYAATNIYILADGTKLSDAQRHTLAKLSAKLKLKLKEENNVDTNTH